MKLCILAAGLGKRMGHLSKHVPKALLPLGEKPVISYIIEKVNPNVPIVIAVGYKKDFITNFCTTAYPDRKFEFVEIDDYSSSDSGPGYSLLKCKRYLQTPFIISTSDDIVLDELPPLTHNWLGVEYTDLPELYSTANVDSSNNIIAFKNKSHYGYPYAFIGLAGIKDYEIYWRELEKVCNKNKEFVDAWINIDAYPNMKARTFKWINVGIIDNYIRARKQFSEMGMPKITGDYTYKIGNSIIKLFQNPKHAYNRIIRQKYIPNTPTPTQHSPHIIKQPYVHGDILYHKPDSIIDFINWCFNNLWKIAHHNAYVSNNSIKEFYQYKTLNRVNQFLKDKPPHYTQEKIINNKHCDSIYNLIHKIPWWIIHDITPTYAWHGDLQFENVICTKNNDFKLIDWRDSFNGNMIGDVNYDLGKMYGGLVLPYYYLRETKNYNIDIHEKKCDTHCSFVCQESTLKIFEEKCEKFGYDIKKIQLMSTIIQLNMCPLHEYPLNDFIFFYALDRLNKLL